ncbi:hypothetical protein [Lactobacillus delbrueckii]|uniref:hypothetical protein n=1 Tax=Lactobacillus delbrueckii TaxID=1584 RepID=UPI0022E1E01A|nr:hypothetical protein [Lactobacillus delbrueckii]
MTNKLREVLMQKPSLVISFSSNDFYSALKELKETGQPQEISNLSNLIVRLENAGSSIKLSEDSIGENSSLVIGKPVKTISYSIENKGKVQKINLYLTENKKEYIVNSNTHLPVWLEIICNKSDLKHLNITCHWDYSLGKSIKDIIRQFYTISTLIKSLTDDVNSLTPLLNSLSTQVVRLTRIEAIQNQCHFRIKTNNLKDISESELKIDKLYWFLVKDKKIRDTAKPTSLKCILDKDNNLDKAIGQQLHVVLPQKKVISFYGKSIDLFYVNVLCNVIVSSIDRKDEQANILFKDSESDPAYISYSAFLNQDEAEKEATKATTEFTDYTNALTIEQLNVSAQ